MPCFDSRTSVGDEMLGMPTEISFFFCGQYYSLFSVCHFNQPRPLLVAAKKAVSMNVWKRGGTWNSLHFRQCIYQSEFGRENAGLRMWSEGQAWSFGLFTITRANQTRGAAAASGAGRQFCRVSIWTFWKTKMMIAHPACSLPVRSESVSHGSDSKSSPSDCPRSSPFKSRPNPTVERE